VRFPFPWPTWRVVLYAVLWFVGTSALALMLTVRNIEALPQVEQIVGISLFMDGWPTWVFGLVGGPALLAVVWRLLLPPDDRVMSAAV
jgi:hypothetical protein